MRPYGWPQKEWRDESFGPTSKHCKMKAKNRREWRRVLSRMGRAEGRREIKRQLKGE